MTDSLLKIEASFCQATSQKHTPPFGLNVTLIPRIAIFKHASEQARGNHQNFRNCELLLAGVFSSFHFSQILGKGFIVKNVI